MTKNPEFEDQANTLFQVR